MSARCCDWGFQSYPDPCIYHDDNPTVPEKTTPQRPSKPYEVLFVVDWTGIIPDFLARRWAQHRRSKNLEYSPWPRVDRLVQAVPDPLPPRFEAPAGSVVYAPLVTAEDLARFAAMNEEAE